MTILLSLTKQVSKVGSNRKLYSLLLLISLFPFPCFTQETYEDLKVIQNNGFEIKDVDGIQFVHTKSIKPKPTIIFIRGSDFAPLFVNGHSLVFPFNFKKYDDEFNFVVMSKPGIPISIDSLRNRFINETYRNGYYINQNAKVPDDFVRNNNLTYYSKAYFKILKYLKKQPWVDCKRLFVVGHSQGANIAASIALKNKNIKKVVLLSTHLGNRFTEAISKVRFQENSNKISSKEAQSRIDSIYTEHERLFLNRENNTELFDSNTFFSYASFTYPSIHEKVIQLSQPTLLIYGTNSIQDLDCDFLKLRLTEKNIKNIKVLPMINKGHNFFTYHFKKNGEYINRTFGWDSVFKEVVDFLR
ncbi:acyl-CoA thioester hydrolase/BAAT C-terminal domain-containing protein [Jiulongibacter sp. NS-SX5]|uniref:acyl-CoA thioester hydrolase/BAAT C-terminal domain-containing protein n=1 Tax=Jiulongibacter sp. NS-SX5 TaxID=3463854 RepID=UPI004058141C